MKWWYDFQGTGGAFFGYLAEEGIRCKTCGNSCFIRLLDIPCKDLFLHYQKHQKLEGEGEYTIYI